MHQFPRDAFPPEPEPQVGWMVELENDEGQRMPAAVAEVTDEYILLDMNHPLAGHDLTFEIELVAVGDEDDESTDEAGEEAAE